MSGPCQRKGLQGGVPKKRKVTPTLAPACAVAKTAEEQRTSFVNLYIEKPEGEVTLQQFEQYATNRKRVLQGIEDAQAKGVKQKDMHELVRKLLRVYMPEPRNAAEADEARATDNTSHFILRMAYCRTKRLQQWFVRLEVLLFRYRFHAADATARLQCMDGLQSIGADEFQSLAAELQAVFCWRDVGAEAHLPDKDKENVQHFKDAKEPWTHIYKVPFEQVADLVRYRRVFLQGGWAYVLSSDAASVAATSFRERLLKGVSACCMKFQEKVDEEEAERLAPLVFNMPERDVCGVFGTAKKLVLAKLDAAMQASAPLCMRRSYGVLKTQHHLKHDARLQLGLFFKGIGVSMDDALAFWQTEFMHGGKTAEEFEKQYSYNFKHQYGQAGSHINYQPYACGKVIAATPDETCATGCPFKTCKSQELAKMLRQMKVSDETVTKTLSLSQEQHYQLACSEVYKGLHGKELQETVTHPQQYFEESHRHYTEKEENEGTAGGGSLT